MGRRVPRSRWPGGPLREFTGRPRLDPGSSPPTPQINNIKGAVDALDLAEGDVFVLIFFLHLAISGVLVLYMDARGVGIMVIIRIC
jgi:hypothetical protein